MRKERVPELLKEKLSAFMKTVRKEKHGPTSFTLEAGHCQKGMDSAKKDTTLIFFVMLNNGQRSYPA